MTAPAPKPTPIDGCLHCGGLLSPDYSEIDFGDEYTCQLSCIDCGASGPVGSGETMPQALEDASSKYGDAISRPQQSAEPAIPVLWLNKLERFTCFGVADYPGKLEHWVRSDAIDALINDDLPHHVAAFPGPSELVEEMERLEVKYRAQCKTLATGIPDFSDGIAAGKQECADDLSALITRHRGKS